MIVDTHVHFGNSARPARIYRNEMPPVFRSIAAPQGVTGVIHVETLGGQPENRWILQLAAADPFILGMVGSMDPRAPDFRDHLSECAADPHFRGIRLHELTDADLADQGFMSNLEMLAGLDRSLDLHLSHEDTDRVEVLAARLPDLRLILNHIGQGRPLTGETPDPVWADGMRRIGDCPNAYCKVSALVQMVEFEPVPADPAFYAPAIDTLWDAFGVDRLLYASNWPQIERVSDYATEFEIVDAYFTGKAEEVRDMFYWRNSKAAYKWADRN